MLEKDLIGLQQTYPITGTTLLGSRPRSFDGFPLIGELESDNNIFLAKPSYQSLFSCIIMTIILSYSLIDILEWTKNVYYMRGALLLLYIIFGAGIYALVMYLLGYKVKNNYI